MYEVIFDDRAIDFLNKLPKELKKNHFIFLKDWKEEKIIS